MQTIFENMFQKVPEIHANGKSETPAGSPACAHFSVRDSSGSVSTPRPKSLPSHALQSAHHPPQRHSPRPVYERWMVSSSGSDQ